MVWNRQARRVNSFPTGISLSSLLGQERVLQLDRGLEGSWPQQMTVRCGPT